MWNQRTKSRKVYLVVAVLLAFPLTRTDASRLKKGVRRNGQKVVSDAASGLRRGVILFGKNASVIDDTVYQADHAGWYPGAPLASDFREHQFKLMHPSLICENTQMDFRANGPARYFALSHDPPVPLSYVPSSCGYTFEGHPFRLVVHVPFHGCNIRIEHGFYILKLLWHGIPVILKCLKPEDVSTTTAPPTLPPFPPLFPWIPGKILPQKPASPTPAPQDPPQMHPDLLFLYLLYYWQYMYSNPNQPLPLPHDPASIPPDFSQYLYEMFKMFPYPASTPPPSSPYDPALKPPLGYWPPPFWYPNPWDQPKWPVSQSNPQFPWYDSKVVPTQTLWNDQPVQAVKHTTPLWYTLPTLPTLPTQPCPFTTAPSQPCPFTTSSSQPCPFTTAPF